MRRILVALAENAATLPDISVERATLERELTAIEEAKSRQDAFVGQKQRATQEMNEAFTRAKEAVLQLQSAAKFKLGPHNEEGCRKRGALRRRPELTMIWLCFRNICGSFSSGWSSPAKAG